MAKIMDHHGTSNHLEDVFFGMRPAARAVWFLRHRAMKSGSSGDGPQPRNQRRDADFVQWGSSQIVIFLRGIFRTEIF